MVSSRYHFMDSFRSVLVSLGFVYHASIILSSTDWPGECRVTGNALSYLINYFHGFRMQGFYLIAGFFALILLQRHGNKEFLKNRLIRLGIPLFFVGLMFNTAMIAALQSYKRTDPLAHLVDINYFIRGEFLSHLWFLPNLILFCGFLVIVNKCFQAVTARCIKNRFGFWQIYGLVMLLALGFAALARYFPKTSNGNWFVFNIRSCCFYLPFFILGVLFYLNKNVFKQFIDSWEKNALILILAIIVASAGASLPYEKYSAYLLRFPIALSVNGILLLFMKKYFDRKSGLSRSVSDASYTMYLLYQPLLVLGALFLMKTNIPVGIRFILLLFGGWSVTYTFHMAIVRKYPVISFLLNGQLPKRLA